MPLAPGTRLGPYQILSPLGAGGMGEVYRARDTRLGREVAIKVLPQHVSTSPEDRARFQREAKAISSLNHPHICVLHDVGREGDTDFLVMELVEGETLAQRLSRGALPTADVLRLGAQIADALARAHRAGVIHRDLKPGNVMLTKSGAKLMDFGLARIAGRGVRGAGDVTRTAPGEQEPITAKGAVVGTVQYLAPEQLEGKEADARSDIWALGCVLYEMATGKRAFEGSTPASIISAIMRDQPREMAGLAPMTPPSLEHLVQQCLEKDPDERWQASRDLQKQLLWIAEAGSRSDVSAPEVARRAGRTGLGWVVAGALGLAAVLLALVSWRAGHDGGSRFLFLPMTYKPMTIFKAAFAPDGKAVVLSAAMEGNTPRIYVIRPEYPEPQPISEPGTHLLSVSSKGELAVLTSPQYGSFPIFSGTLARMPLGGGAPREIARGVIQADWSPDGSDLAVIRGVYGGTLQFPLGHVLYKADSGYLTDVRFSPRGDRVAFFEHPPGGWNSGGSLKMVDLHGKSSLVSGGFSSLSGIAWRADGGEIYFSGSRGGGEEVIYAATLNGKLRVALQSAGGPTIHDVSRTGQWLVTRDDSRNSVMVHKPDWQVDRDFSWLDASQQGLLARDASFLVFTEYGEALGSRATVCLRRGEDSPVTRIGEGFGASLSPDGSRIISKSDSSSALFIQPTGIGEARLLPHGILESYNHAWWFPSGDSILIRGNEHGKAFRLYVQDLVGGLPRPLTKEGPFQAAIAHDGSWVIAKGPAGCFRYRFDGSLPDSVPWLGRGEQLLPWHVDDQSVLAITGPWRDVPLHILRVDLATGRRTPFLDINPANRIGLLECNLSSFSADFRSYSYDAAWVLSSLFLVKPMAHGRM